MRAPAPHQGPARPPRHHREAAQLPRAQRKAARRRGGLAAIAPGRRAAVCRELTKLQEEVGRGSAEQLAAHYLRNGARGEVVLVCGGSAPASAGAERALTAVRELVDAGAKPR